MSIAANFLDASVQKAQYNILQIHFAFRTYWGQQKCMLRSDEIVISEGLEN